MFKKIIAIIFFILYYGRLFSQDSETNSLALKWVHYKLQNGINIILQPDPKQAEVSVEFWVGAGARDEEVGKFGFAHFFEHATPYGLTTDTFLLKRFLSFKTNSNAQTKKDYTRYYIQVKPDGLNLALRYTAERLKADTGAINNNIIEKHRSNVINEIDRQESNALYGASATSVREEGTFGKHHPYGHSTYGSIKEIQLFASFDVKNWYERYFFTNNIILFVVGNFDVKNVKATIENEFGNIYRKGARINLKKISAKTLPVGARISIPSKNNCLSITWAIPKYGAVDNPALQLLSKILDQRLNSSKKFPNSIIEQGDLFNLYELAGQFGIYANFLLLADSTSIANYLHQAIDDVIIRGISQSELKKAKQNSVETVKIFLTKPGFINSRTELLGEGFLFTKNPDFYLLQIRKESVLTTKDIQKAAVKWLSKKGFQLLTVSKNNFLQP